MSLLTQRTRTRTPAQQKVYAMGVQIKDIADHLGVSTNTIWATLSGKASHPLTRRAIAESVGLTEHQLFSDEPLPDTSRRLAGAA